MITLTSLAVTYLFMKVAQAVVLVWREARPYKLPPRPTAEAQELQRLREEGSRREAKAGWHWPEM